jgi:hypothetical protein
MTVAEFLTLLRMRGWARFPSVLSAEFTAQLALDLQAAYERCRDLQIARGMDAGTYGTAHHILGHDTSLDELLRRRTLHEYLAAFFGGPYILNSYGGVLNHPGHAAYVSRVHRDVRTYLPGSPLMINMLVMLDPFTSDNGATLVLSGSNHIPERPSDEFFFQHSERFLGAAGDIVLFDSNVWHAAGENRSSQVRRALTLTFTRPFMKQQLDYPRYLSNEYANKLDDHMRQILGYKARVPADLDEWYQPPASRFYQPDQG